MAKRNAVAVPVADVRKSLDVPGAYEIRQAGKSTGMAFVCPCGCGQEDYIPLDPGRSESWEWDGNREKPTLSPSLQRMGGCGWHGFLRAGVFEEC